MVIECPQCHSKYNLDDEQVTTENIKLRCQICSNVFALSDVLDQPSRSGLEQEFESLVSEQDQDSLIDETPEEESDESAGVSAPIDEIQPESVIREIDSILGAGEEVPEEQDAGGEETGVRITRRKTRLVGLIAAAVALVIYLGYAYTQGMPPFKAKAEVQTEPQQVEYLVIPQESVSYEILPHQTEGEVLVFKGLIEKKTTKPIQYILIQARVHDENKTLLEAKDSYAGVVPENSELSALPPDDIDVLLSAQPQNALVVNENNMIPFAVAFFGKAAEKGKYFYVEIKEFDWQ